MEKNSIEHNGYYYVYLSRNECNGKLLYKHYLTV